MIVPDQVPERVRHPEPPPRPDALGASQLRSEEALRPHVVLDEADDRREAQGEVNLGPLII